MAVAADDVERTEGKTTWLLVGLIALIFVPLPLWILFGGTAPVPPPPLPAHPVATLEHGQKIAFAAGDLAVGDGLICESNGLRVGARVPRPGHTTHSQLVAPNYDWTATIEIHAREDGAVIVGCA